MLERGGIQHSKLLIIVDGSKIKALGPLDLEKKKKKKLSMRIHRTWGTLGSVLGNHKCGNRSLHRVDS